MSSRWLNNFTAVCFVILFLAIILLLAGCTTYSVHRDANGTVDVQIASTRSFDAPDMHYSRQGADASFDFKAAGVDNNTNAIIGLLTPFVNGFMSMYSQMSTGGLPTAAVSPPAENQAGGILTTPSNAEAIYQAGLVEGRRQVLEAVNKE